WNNLPASGNFTAAERKLTQWVQGYSATLLNNESILFIGGQPGGDPSTLSYPLLDKLSMYNINNDTWITV
ncbi:27491_t:CDS:2, partial [Racocetra persica]